MRKTIQIDNLGKGLNLDLPSSDLELGMASGSTTGWRFADGCAQLIDGTAGEVSASVIPYWLDIYGTATNRYVVYSGIAKVYAYDTSAASHTEITRYTAGVAITSMTAAGTTVTVTTTVNHGRSTGNVVNHYGATESAYNASGKSITVTGATTYTYVADSAPAAPASVVGYYEVTTTNNFTGAIDNKVSGGTFNGIEIVNNPVDGLFYWNGDTSLRLRPVPGAHLADISVPHKNFIIQLAPTISGTKYPYDVVWSSVAEPGALPDSFTATSTNEAGRVTLAETDGFLVDAVPLGDGLVIYKRDAAYLMRYVGGDQVFSFQRLPGSDGLNAPRCAVEVPEVGHVILTASWDIRIHNGGPSRSIAQGRVRKYMRSVLTVNAAYGQRANLFVNKLKSEVWVCFPGNTSSSNPDTFLLWNWVHDTWGRAERLEIGVYHGVSGLYPQGAVGVDLREVTVINSSNQTKFGLLNGAGGTALFSQSFNPVLELRGLHFGDRDRKKHLDGSRWNIDSSNGAGTITVKHGSADFADTSPTYTSGATYTIGTTDYVNQRATQGRFGAVQFSSPSSSSIQVRSGDLAVVLGGTR